MVVPCSMNALNLFCPQRLTANPEAAGDRKLILAEDKYNATNFLTLWDFEGIFKYSPIFYGWYTNEDGMNKGYRLPFAYFVTGLVVYAYSFFAILQRMAVNSRMSKLSEKDDECVFSWKLFTGWDYMIGNPETAHNRVASTVMGLKAALLEEAEKKREPQNWKIVASRILVNLGILGLLALSVYAVILVVHRSKEPESTSTVWRRNEITMVMGLISISFPTIFEIIGLVEHYHPRTQLRIQLARIMVLYLLNLYSLIFALFGKISEMTTELQQLKPIQISPTQDTTTSLTTIEQTPFDFQNSDLLDCYKSCNSVPSEMILATQVITAIISNISTTTVIPKLMKALSSTAEYLETTSQSSFHINATDYSDYEEYFNATTTNFSERTTPENLDDYYDISMFNWDPSNESSSSSVEYNFTTDYPNATDWRAFTLEIIKSTTPTWTDFTSEATEQTAFDVDEETKSILNEITTAITYLQENETSWTQQCILNCNALSDNETTTVTTSVTTVNLNQTQLLSKNDYPARSKLRSLCWETMFGQELVKLTIMDMILTVLSTLGVDFFRGIFVRVMNNCWCWDLEKKFPQYGDFKVAENILHLVNNQGMVWMGMFFAPGLVPMNVVKLYLMMYFRTWTVLTCNVPHKIIFRASKSNNFYFGLLLWMLFLCVLPVGYAIVWLEPSWHCGPFSKYARIFHIFTKTIHDASPEWMHGPLDYIASPGIVIPLLVLLILIIYYLVSLTNALREANEDLKIQLRRERTEERRKMFQMAIGKRKRGGSGGSADLAHVPFDKWKKLLSELPYGKSIDETPKQESQEAEEVAPKEQKGSRGKDFFSKLVKLALRKTPEDENKNNEDNTDTEQHDSLPEDQTNYHPVKKHQTTDQNVPKTVKTKREAFKEESHRAKVAPLAEATQSSSQQSQHGKRIREDSIASIWSDNIPTITISKTESAECILEATPKEKNSEEGDEKRTEGFKPRVKYALRKQDAEVDIDSISFISHEIVQKFEIASAVSEEGKEAKKNDEEEKRGKPSSCRDAVHQESIKTESSSDYKESNLS